MDQIRARTTLLSWDADKRVAVLRYEAETRSTGEDAKPLVAALRQWVGTQNETFFFLHDCGPLLHMDTEYRAIWWDLFRPYRDSAWIALYNLRPFIKILAEMYFVATGLKMKVFDNEEVARAWLREKGAAI